MDEITMVERMFAEPPPSMDVTAAGRDRLVELARGSGRRSGTTLRWAFGIGLAGAATAVAGIVIASGPTSGPRAPSARQILLTAAERSTATSPGTGRYLRIRTESGTVEPVGPPGHRYGVLIRRVDDRWYPNAPGVAGWYVYQKLGARPVTAADAARWRADGSPRRWRPQCEVSVSPTLRARVKGSLCPPIEATADRPRTEWMGGGMAAFLTTPGQLDTTKLSADPATLRRQLLNWTRGGGLAGPVEGDTDQLWAAAGTVLFEPHGPVSPRVRAAAYRILAGLPGVRTLGEVTDPSGRTGQGLALTTHGSEDRIIIDLATGFPLADVEYTGGRPPAGLRSGELQDYTMVLRSQATDQAPPHTGPCTPECR